MQPTRRDGSDRSRYRELAPPHGLRPQIVCAWQRTLSRGTPAQSSRILPDGCVDIIHVAGRGLFVAGPDTTAQTVAVEPGYAAAGVRFQIGAAAAGLGLPACELRDVRVGLDELWGSDAARLQDALDEQPSAGERVRMLAAGLAPRLLAAAAPDPLVAAAVAAIRSGSAGRVASLAMRLAISERQLRRRFETAVGYGPKRLQRVLRVQRLRALAAAGELGTAPLARLAFDAGYADQAHMSAECRDLCGLPPAALLRAA